MMLNRSANVRSRWLLTPLLLLSVWCLPTLAWADPPPRQEWARLFGTANDDRAISIAVSRSGQIYAGGHTNPPGGARDNFLAKINNCAVPEWFQQWDGNIVSGVAVDDCEFVSVAADNDIPPPGPARLRRLDQCGRCYWEAGFPDLGTPYYSGGVGIWRTLTYVGARSSLGVHVAQFDPSGNRRWVATLNHTTDGFHHVGDLTVDHHGNCYLAGQTDKTATGQPTRGGQDNFVVKFDRNGQECWRQIWGTDRSDQPLDVVLDRHGNVIVCANATIGATTTTSLVVFDGNGTLRSNTPVTTTNWNGATFDLAGRLYRNEGFHVSRYLFEPTNATWTRDSWQWSIPAISSNTQVRWLASDPQGNIYLTGYTDRDFFGEPRLGGVDGFVVKLVTTN